MAFGALRFIGLTLAAVILGVMSAAVAFGQFGPPHDAFYPSTSSAALAIIDDEIRTSETLHSLRHIKRSK